MVVTEKVAATKWCPFARVGVYAGSGAVAVNRHPDSSMLEDARCIGSGCMAWRLSRDPEPKAFPAPNTTATEEPEERPAHVPPSYEFVPFDAEDPDLPARWVEPAAERIARRTGRCGLVGSE